MLSRFLSLFLTLFSPFTNFIFLEGSTTEWLGCTPTVRFAQLFQFSEHEIEAYEERFVPYLKDRGVIDENLLCAYILEDLRHIAQALSILFEQDETLILNNLFGKHAFLLKGCNFRIDHVGRELYGPISFYIPLLEQIAPGVGLKKLHHQIFPSEQVVKVLQEYDSSVKGVSIGRIYFQDDVQGSVRCIELFQASPIDGSDPQHIAATEERLSLLTASKVNSNQLPIDHLSIQLNTVEQVQNIHLRIQQLSSELLLPYQKRISHNVADGSVQTKMVIRDCVESPFNKIVEFVHYQAPYN